MISVEIDPPSATAAEAAAAALAICPPPPALSQYHWPPPPPLVSSSPTRPSLSVCRRAKSRFRLHGAMWAFDAIVIRALLVILVFTLVLRTKTLLTRKGWVRFILASCVSRTEIQNGLISSRAEKFCV